MSCSYPNKFDQILFGTVEQAYDMGAAAVGATIYFGSDGAARQIVEVAQVFAELGMATVTGSGAASANVAVQARNAGGGGEYGRGAFEDGRAQRQAGFWSQRPVLHARRPVDFAPNARHVNGLSTQAADDRWRLCYNFLKSFRDYGFGTSVRQYSVLATNAGGRGE